MNTRSPFLIRLFVMGLALFVQVGDASAQKLEAQYKKPMPKIEEMSASDFERQTKVYTNSMSSDKALAYEIRLPREWTEDVGANFSSMMTGKNVQLEIGKFFGPASMSERSFMEVNAVKLDHAMTAEQWLIQFLLANGYNSQGFVAHNRNSAEAAYVILRKNISYVVRTAARINGKRLVFASYFIPMERWHEEKTIQASILKSFKLTNKVEEYVEAMELYQFLDLAEFQYPMSWRLKVLPIKSIDRMKIELLNTVTMQDMKKGEARLDGKIDIALVSVFASETLEDELVLYDKALKESGILKGELIEGRNDYFYHEAVDFGDTQVYEAVDEGNTEIPYEFWMTIMAAGDFYYLVSLYTPARDTDYSLWVRNTETYKLLTSLIKPLEDVTPP